MQLQGYSTMPSLQTLFEKYKCTTYKWTITTIRKALFITLDMTYGWVSLKYLKVSVFTFWKEGKNNFLRDIQGLRIQHLLNSKLP
jgi:hypothetical protein